MVKYRLTESRLRGMIKEAVKRALYEGAYDDNDSVPFSWDEWDDSYDDSYEDHTWYNEEDYDGNFGRPGMIRSYYTQTIYLDNAELDAQESGYDDVIEYLRYWASECLPDCPWYWIEQKSGYGHNGNALFEDDNIVDGHLVCKEIYDQVMFDAYPPTGGASGADAMLY